MSILVIVQAIFLVLALAIVVWTLFPSWEFANGPALAMRRVITGLLMLLVLALFYVLILAVFGAPVALR